MIRILDVIKTSYEDDTYWLMYESDRGVGYEMVNCKKDKKEWEQLINSIESLVDLLNNKPHINTMSSYLQLLLTECMQSENDMWFVELDDEEYLKRLKAHRITFLPQLIEEVKKIGLDEFFEFNPIDSEAYIVVYGGAITKVLF